ncbi:MAG: cob(I)yrinic acid a,c-diamide adenosyltransferase [Deltaproteobacteria bacterium]|nr:cob(I)yrinic acid a,c-diamide adenosyltransferase [Deltaproteobacteria bacterium]
MSLSKKNRVSLERGYVHVYSGHGKGKTTAAIGLGMRAAGMGLQVIMIQFMKGRRYCEIDSLALVPNFEVAQHGRDDFVSKERPDRVDIELAQKGLEHAGKAIASGEYDVVILDEINVAVDFGLLAVQEVVRLVAERPVHVEVVLTGRYAPAELIEMADLVTEMREIKHFYSKGVEARKGIEY